jgi:hypothetical protein
MDARIIDKHIVFIFPKSYKTYRKTRIDFMHKMAFVNGWTNIIDIDVCITDNSPNFERLFDYFRITKLVPYFSRLIISFVKSIEEFVAYKKNMMYIFSEALLISWQ